MIQFLKDLFGFKKKVEVYSPLPKPPNSFHKDSQGFFVRDITGRKHYVDEKLCEELGLK
jgi:hypothetical protein